MKLQFEGSEDKQNFINKMINASICPYHIGISCEEPFDCGNCMGCWEIALVERENEGVFVLAASDGYSIEQAAYDTLKEAQCAMEIAYDSYIDDLKPEWLEMSNLGDRDAIIYNNGEDVHTWNIFKVAYNNQSATPPELTKVELKDKDFIPHDSKKPFDKKLLKGKIVMAFTNSPEHYKEDFTGEGVLGYYTFDAPKKFLKKWKEIVKEVRHPWYWVLDDGWCLCFGAIHPNDMEKFRAYFGLKTKKKTEPNFWFGNYCIVDVQDKEDDFDLSESHLHPHTAIFVATSKKKAKRKFRKFLETAPEGKRYESDGKVKKTTCISLSHNI